MTKNLEKIMTNKNGKKINSKEQDRNKERDIIEKSEENPSALAISSAILGALSLLLCCGPTSIIFGFSSIIIGAIEWHNIDLGKSSEKGIIFAKAGILLGILGLLLLIAQLVLWGGFTLSKSFLQLIGIL